MLKETPKRLAPARDTVRELYLKSGNRCAFPGCAKALFNGKGVFVGQICHIEAAEPKGERFNKFQTNEERRLFSNLMLMCYDHHVETNDVIKFSVESMKKMKAAHEQKFSDVIGTMLATVTDLTKLNEPIFARNLRKMKTTLKWTSINDEELKEHTDILKSVVEKLKVLPRQARELFLILLTRSKPAGSNLEISAAEVQHATELSHKDLRELFSILDDHGFTFDNDTNDFGIQMIGISNMNDEEWPLWDDLRKVCKRHKVDLSNLILQLDFSSLDAEL